MNREPAIPHTVDLPLVSVVTPCFNAAPFVRATIESVLRQGYPQLQHVVIDGGSQDGTVDILKEYPHLEWISERDRGQSDALNKCFRRAKGTIIGWLNADDTYEPGAIHAAVRHLVAHPEVDAVYGDVNIIDEHGLQVGAALSEPFDTIRLLSANMIKQPALFMTRRVIDELGGVDERWHYVMDQELWLRMGMAGFRFDRIAGQPLANFRLCGGTKTFANASRFHLEWNLVVAEAIDRPFFDSLPSERKRLVRAGGKADYHLAKMLEAMDRGARVDCVLHLARAIGARKSLVTNRGVWRFLTLALLGVSRDKLRKFSRRRDSIAQSSDV